MAIDYNTILYTGSTEPKPSDYPTERQYAQAYQEWGNRRNTQKLQDDFAKALSSDDNKNSGTNNSVATSTGDSNSVTSSYREWSELASKGGNPATDTSMKPGSRPKNILGDYSSYTYSLSLYLITPEFYNDYINANGALPPSDGIFVVAQSGGINNTFDQRLITKSGQIGKGQQGLDLYIEDLDITTVLPGGAGRATTTSDIRFKIIEPNGFTFLTDLAKASGVVAGKSDILKASKSPPRATDQKYILGIRFFGYDVDGNLVKDKSKLQSKSNSSYSDAYSIAERFIAIRFSSVKFKLDGKATTYNIEAYQESEQNTYSQANGTISSAAALVATGGTVGEALQGGPAGEYEYPGDRGLMQFLNQTGEDLKAKGDVTIPNVYKIKWIGDRNPIPDSKLVDDKQVEKRLTDLSPGRTTDKINVSESFKAAVFNPNSRSVTFPAGTAIVTAIDNLIVKSTYVTDALTQVNDGNAETGSVKNAASKPLQWYAINPVTKVLGIDTKNNKFAYEITYEISVYEIPYARTQYKATSPKYPGPFKYYSFMLTGENSEVLEYEQTYNNLYYVVATPSTSQSTAAEDKAKKGVEAPINVQGASNSDPTGGKINKGSQINENVRAQLYSPGDQAEAKLKILGDPDYIMTQIGISQSSGLNQQTGSRATASAQSVYGPDFTINPMSGQTFIQIVFNIASDYDDNGLMDVSDKIQFYASNDVAASGIKGIVYQVNQVQSSFSRGSFTQMLDCVLVPESQLVTSKESNTDKLPTAGSSSPASESDFNAADLRSSTSDSDGLAFEFDNTTTASDTSSSISQVQNFENELPGADDDQITVANKQIQTGGIVTDTAREVFGTQSVDSFGTTAGGAALFPTRINRRNQRL